MENIQLRIGDVFEATTITKGNHRDLGGATLVEDYAVITNKNSELAISSTEEAPLFFGVKDRLLGAAKIDLQRATSLYIKKQLHTTITAYGLNPEDIHAYIGPCLTFSHQIVERPLIEKMMALGYQAACKRTDGVDFFDVPVMILVQLRELGIPMENIHITDYDTYENPDLLYSKLRADGEENLTFASLI